MTTDTPPGSPPKPPKLETSNSSSSSSDADSPPTCASPVKEEKEDSPVRDWKQIFLDATIANLNSWRAEREAEATSEAETAIVDDKDEDTLDGDDDAVVEENRKKARYDRRRRRSESIANTDAGGSNTRHGRRLDGPTRKWLAKVRAVLPFDFHPNVRPLSISDLESCVALENAAFTDPAHRCTREKFEYRLTRCPELSLGLFCTVVPSQIEGTGFDLATLPAAHVVETGRADGAKSVLLAHIVSTRSDNMTVTDESMDYPNDFRIRNRAAWSPLGHQANGQTVCLHSVAVLPRLQGCGLGKVLMKAYIQQQKHSGVVRWCALICQEYLIPYYAQFQFEYNGPSIATFGGGGWHNMLLYLYKDSPRGNLSP